MAKLIGNLRITAKPAAEGIKAYFELMFIPYAGRLATQAAKATTYDELVAFLQDLKFGEDEAMSWAGKARSQGIILISSFERQDSLLREKGLIA